MLINNQERRSWIAFNKKAGEKPHHSLSKLQSPERYNFTMTRCLILRALLYITWNHLLLDCRLDEAWREPFWSQEDATEIKFRILFTFAGNKQQICKQKRNFNYRISTITKWYNVKRSATVSASIKLNRSLSLIPYPREEGSTTTPKTTSK